MSARALVVLANGFEDIEAITVVDVLRRGEVEVVTASLAGGLDVRSAHGVVMRADATFADAADAPYNAIVLPGGGEGTANLRGSEALRARLFRQKEDGGLICAICAAPLVLVDIEGLLEPGLHVTCYPTCALDLDRPCAGVPVVSDGNIITGQAPGSSMLFALVILRTLEGDRVAGRVARGLVTSVLD